MSDHDRELTDRLTRFQPPVSCDHLRSIDSGERVMRRQAKLDRKLLSAIFDREMMRPFKVKDPR